MFVFVFFLGLVVYVELIDFVLVVVDLFVFQFMIIECMFFGMFVCIVDQIVEWYGFDEDQIFWMCEFFCEWIMVWFVDNQEWIQLFIIEYVEEFFVDILLSSEQVVVWVVIVCLLVDEFIGVFFDMGDEMVEFMIDEQCYQFEVEQEVLWFLGDWLGW